MNLTKNALRSVIDNNDLSNFVSKKRNHRIDYLHSLSDIVTGILIFNKHSASLEAEPLRDCKRYLTLSIYTPKDRWSIVYI